MELREYADLFKKSWLLIVIMSLLGLGAGAAATLLMTPKYESRTQIYVSTRWDAEDSWEMVQGADYSSQAVYSYIQVVPSGAVLDPVIAQLGLDMTTAELAENVTASTAPDSVLLDIVATSPSAQQSADIANAVGESLKEVVRTQLEPASPAETSRVTLTTTQVALIPEDPEQPKPVLNLALGLVAGFVLGYIVALLRRVLDTRIRSTRDVEEITDTPVIGEIIDTSSVEEDRVVVYTDPRSPRAESFRSLRTSLMFLNIDSGDGSFIITSANQGEGKSTAAVNLAAALSQAGSKVLLVDSDLRLPMIAEYLDIEGAVGLTDVLIGRAELEDVIQRWGESEFYVLPAGQIPPNPSELLGSEGMKNVVESVREEYDYVLFDAPPIRAVTDAVVLSKLVSGVLMVVAAGSTTKPELEGALRGLKANGITPLGLVVTRLPAKGPDSYNYNYSYTYGESSGEEGNRKRGGRRRRRRRKREAKGIHAR